VLLPVELSRKSARSGYRVRAADDEPVVNPALAEYLRLDFGITLPSCPTPPRCLTTTICRSFLSRRCRQ
jgi:hypothetical protein